MSKHPNIRVKLSGRDGNALSIVGKVSAALREGRVPRSEIDAFQKEALSGNYDMVLRTACSWVAVS